MKHQSHQLWSGVALMVAGAALAYLGDRAIVYGILVGFGVLLVIVSFGSDKE